MPRFRLLQVVIVLALIVASASASPSASDPRYSFITGESIAQSVTFPDKVVERDVPIENTPLALNVTAIASGGYHTCAVTNTGGVKCWGQNSSGQVGDGTTTRHFTPVDASGLNSGVMTIATGGSHTCALTGSGGVKCWGNNALGQLGDGTTTQRLIPVDVSGLTSGVTMVAAGVNYTCALTDTGGVKCWGDNQYGQLGDGTTTDRLTPVDVRGLTNGVTAIALGTDHTCALTITGGAKCWGTNYFGQLGDGSAEDRLTPVDVSGLMNGVVAIAAGRDHTCASTISGGTKCWGNNYFGQLGDGTMTDHLTPVDVSGLTSGVTMVVADELHTCALVGNGGIKCWGWNYYGQLGDATLIQRPMPVNVVGLTSGVANISTGSAHTCALTSGGVKCWGSNSDGQLGNGTAGYVVTPGDVSGLTSSVTEIAAGSRHSCALTNSGVRCWGDNFSGQVGDGTTTLRLTPVNVSTLTSGINAIAAGNFHNCALTSSGGVKCWGNNWGQLGDGTTTTRLTPVDVSGLTSGVTAITAGRLHTCALTASGGVKCWGQNSSGQVGDGTTTTRLKPVNVSGLTSGVAAIAAGFSHTCALTTSGGVKCWGSNPGDGTATNRLTPVDVSGLTSGVTAISAGGALHTCALTTSSGVKCWGNNRTGQLGDGTTTNRLTPVDVIGLTSGVTAIAAGSVGDTCALTSAGAVKCWGNNSYGELGDGTTTDRLTPVAVTGLGSGVTAIDAGGAHTCALTRSGGVKCWGNNSEGELGNGIPPYSVTPIDVMGLGGGVSYSILGQVRDANNNPMFGVFVTTSSGATGITNANGYYAITGLITGTYTLTPTKSAYAFSPCSRTVNVPPNATGQDFTATPIDLLVDSVLPVQVLEGQNLVRDKATAIKAVIRKSGCGTANNVSVRFNVGALTFSRFHVADPANMNSQYTLMADNATYPLNFTTNEITKTIYLFSDSLAPIGSTFQASVTVDYLGVIAESDEANNTASSASIPVYDTQWTGLLTPDLYLQFFRTDWGNRPLTEFDSYYQSSNDFLRGVYPVAERRFTPNASANYVGSTALYRYIDGKLSALELTWWIFNTLQQIRLAHPTADRYIAVVPSGWFAANTTGTLTNAFGYTNPNMRELVVVEARTTNRPNGPSASTVAHEIGHSYGLHIDCEDYYFQDADCARKTRENAPPDRIGEPAAIGLWLEKRIPIQVPAVREIYSFMGGYADREFWAATDDYSRLLNDHKTSSLLGATETTTITQAILAVGIFDITGTVTLDNWYVLPEAELSTLPPGEYAFEYLDAGGGMLYQKNFDISYISEGITITQAPFVFTIPYISGTAKIVIKNNNVPLAEKIVSPNTPAVSVISPNGGDKVTRQTTIQWSSSDADGDALSYTILFSADDGSTWEPIAGNLTATSYVWNTSDLPPGTKYRVKIIATDGINTREDTSNSSFTIQGSAYLPLVRRS